MNFNNLSLNDFGSIATILSFLLSLISLIFIRQISKNTSKIDFGTDNNLVNNGSAKLDRTVQGSNNAVHDSFNS